MVADEKYLMLVASVGFNWKLLLGSQRENEV